AGGAAPSRRSITTKSLPAPCILGKRSGDRVITCRGVRGAVTATGSSAVVVRGQRSGRHAVARWPALVGTGPIAFRAFPGFDGPAGPVGLIHLLGGGQRRVDQRHLVAARGEAKGEQQRQRREEQGGSAHAGSVARAAGRE